MGRRVALAVCLLWVVGWVAVAPSTVPGPPGPFYAATVLVGTLLCCAAVAARVRGPDRGAFSGDSLPIHLALAGCAFAVPGVIGLTLGAEVLALLFALLTAVAVIFLFLFR